MNARRFISIVFLATLAVGLTACGHDEPELAKAECETTHLILLSSEDAFVAAVHLIFCIGNLGRRGILPAYIRMTKG